MIAYIINIKKNERVLNKYLRDTNQIKLSNALIKLLISNNTICYTKFGKPYFKDKIKFNISHSGKYIVLILSSGINVGIDIEEIKLHKNYLSITKKYFKNDEFFFIDDSLKNFLTIWTRKESFIKCLGISIINLKKIPNLIKNKIIYKNNLYYIKTFFYKKYIISITYKSNTRRNIHLKEINSIGLLKMINKKSNLSNINIRETIV